MHQIPLISGSTSLLAKLKKIIAATSKETNGIALLSTSSKAIDYLNIEMPELAFIDFSDARIDGFLLLKKIMNDPWLLQGGIIALAQDRTVVDRIEKIKGANIVVTLLQEDIGKQLPRILSIIDKNRSILFQREIGSDIVGNISGSFKLNNSTFEATCYANLICNFLYNSNRLDIKKKEYLRLALSEMLLNAIEHGNCGISFDEKTVWLENGRFITELIEKKCKNPDVKNKYVTFEYAISPTCSHFLILDQGEGFDWRKAIAGISKENLFSAHGRGIILTQGITQNLTYNEKGNQVTFEIAYERDAGNITPALFKNIEPLELKKGDIVVRQGEASNFLYYIAKGAYDVIVNDKKITSLSTEDIFLGEMSFLLNDRRSATIQAASEGKLFRISQRSFIEAIKKKPHYALLLSRLLAQRIQRLNIMAARGQSG